MAEFTFGIGQDDTDEALLQDEDFFDPDTIEPGLVPELNTRTTIVNLKEPETIQRAAQDYQSQFKTIETQQASCEALLKRMDRLNGVNASIALEAIDTGLDRAWLPSAHDYDTRPTNRHLNVTAKALSLRQAELGTSMESLIEKVADGFKKAYLTIQRIAKNIHKQIVVYMAKNTKDPAAAARYFNRVKKAFREQEARANKIDEAVADVLRNVRHMDAAARSLMKAQDEARRTLRSIEDELFEVAQARGLFRTRQEFRAFLESDELL